MCVCLFVVGVVCCVVVVHLSVVWCSMFGVAAAAGDRCSLFVGHRWLLCVVLIVAVCCVLLLVVVV